MKYKLGLVGISISNLFFYFKPSQEDTCIETSISCIQVWPTKFAFMKIKSR
jgi:hypothetical protein